MKNFIWFAILALSLTSSVSSASFCDKYKAPKIFTDTKAKVDERIKIFANKKDVAQKADATLSSLVKAKSPVIASWMTRRNLNSKSEEEIIREWRDYYARNFILTKYPHGEPAIDKDIETLMADINNLFNQKSFQDKIQTLFDKSKKQSLLAVKTFPISEEQRTQITSRIEAIRLYWMKDFKTSKFTHLPMEFLDWGIAYDPTANEINMGINSLAYPNDETYLAVFSHEIGHSFDPCRWGAYFKGEWPFQKIGECLRSPKSVGAKKRDDSKMDVLSKANKELATSLKANPTCNKMGYPPTGLQADQLPESFADWFSAEAMATDTKLKSSDMRTDLCEAKSLSPTSSYPTNDIRLKAIYFSHPKFKGSGPNTKADDFTYCGFAEATK